MKLKDLHEARPERYFAAVACVRDNTGRWLLGKSTATDDRKGKWCFVGGGVEGGETPQQAACRECWEESGVHVLPFGPVIITEDKPGVAFIYCRVVGPAYVKKNNEFSEMGFFTLKEMQSLDLYNNVDWLIRTAR